MRFRKGLFAALCCSGGLTAACTLLMGAFPLPGALGIFPFAVWAPLWIGWESAAAWGLLALGAAQAACRVPDASGYGETAVGSQQQRYLPMVAIGSAPRRCCLFQQHRME